MMPIPPSRAISLAIRASVTVSMLALTIGIASVMPRHSCVRVSTCWRVLTPDRRGTSSTSSNVSPISNGSLISPPR